MPEPRDPSELPAFGDRRSYTKLIVLVVVALVVVIAGLHVVFPPGG
jgi:hypothetical protein